MINQTLTFKIQHLYAAYSPSTGVCCYGDCWEEAVNGLTEKLRAIRERGDIILNVDRVGSHALLGEAARSGS